MDFWKKKDEQPSSLVTVVARDSEATNKVFRDHATNAINTHATVLAENGWIAEQTIELLRRELGQHNIHLNLDTRYSTGAAGSNQIAARRPSNSHPHSPVPPPLPSRSAGSSNPLTRLPTPNPPSPVPPALPLRKPSVSSITSSFSNFNTGNSNNNAISSNPVFQKAAMNAAADPRIQNAAFNAAKDPSFQKAAFGAASSFASGQPPAKVASSLASNPAFQKAAANAAKDPGVRAAAWDAAKDSSLQKAALSGVSSSLGYRPQPPQPIQARKTTVLAIADFDAVEGDDLPIREGDVITVLEEIDENWYRGTSSRGTGMFPKNHVQPN